ncbi:MAG: chemotaxis protein CheA [Ferruginibacter sp.]|nr:chemotaxis protein CheA [Cytophagales bacterium]
MNSEEEYKEIFLAEALENHEEMNRLLTTLEKESDNRQATDAIFRITHTLKGNAAGMGFEDIARLAHVVEDVFGEIRSGQLALSAVLFTDLFKATDTLGALIQALKTGKVIRYQGIKTKLEVTLRNQRQERQAVNPTPTEPVSPVSEPVEAPILSRGSAPLEAAAEPVATAALPPAPSEPVAPPSESDQAAPESVGENQLIFSDLVQVPVRKLDLLLNLVGELTIERDRLMAVNAGRHNSNEYNRLSRISSDLQYSVMDVRLVQVGFLFNKFHRVVRDAATQEGKRVSLRLEGTDTEIDRNVLKTISDSLIHLIRNAVGHGVETPAQRRQSAKPEIGVVTLKARSESDEVVIEIEDDGQGIDCQLIRRKAIEKGLVTAEMADLMGEKELLGFIFEPGFSSAEQVTAISGRGVGMDVVKKALDSIGGTIGMRTCVGKGTTIRLSLPSSLAVKATLLFELQDTKYAIPLHYTQAVVSLRKKDLHKVGNGLVATHLDKMMAVVFLKDLFEAEETGASLHRGYNALEANQQLFIVIVSYNERTVGLVVDKLLQQKEIVEKPLMKPVDHVRFISGVTILGNGHVCLVLHVPAIVQTAFRAAMGVANPGLVTGKEVVRW